MNHGFWGDLIGFDHTVAILLPVNEHNAPIDAGWLRDFETVIPNLPRLKSVLVERIDITDKMLIVFRRKFANVEFKRSTTN